MSCSGQKRRFGNAPTTSGSSRSSIGAFGRSLISRSTCRSTMRRAADFRSSSCGIESIRVRVAYFGDNMNDQLKQRDSPCSDKFAK
jgi:hypothetical protein